jgi:hypothetical protein
MQLNSNDGDLMNAPRPGKASGDENLIKRRSRNVSSWRQSLLIALDVDAEDQSSAA